jgi:transcription elongation GreA/GreB family factor
MATDLASPAEMLRHADQVEEQTEYQAARDRNHAQAAAIAELRRVVARANAGAAGDALQRHAQAGIAEI